MDVEKLIEKGARVVERAAYDAFLSGDTSYRRAAGALIAMTLKEAAQEAETLKTLHAWLQTGDAPEGGAYEHATIHGKKISDHLLALAEQVEKANV